MGNGEPNGFKSVTAFFPQETSTSNGNFLRSSLIYFFSLTCFSFEYFDGLNFGLVSVVISGLGPDYTRMESFGKVEEFADTLVCLSYHFAVFEPNL